MPRTVEKSLRVCKVCKKTTMHYRNTNQSSAFMVLIHIVLSVSTLGLWLVFVVIWKLGGHKIGGWTCSRC